MKIKWIKILLLMILVICLVACESETTPKKESPDTSLETTNVEEDIESEEEIIETEEETPEDETELVVSEQLDNPVETNPPEADFEPAFENQTRVNGVRTVTEYSVEKIAEGLDSPWGISPLNDGSFAITQKSGTMKILSVDGELSKDITGFPEVDSNGQGGLLDVTADTDFDSSRLLYFTFSEPSEEGNLTALGSGILSEDLQRIEDFQVIYRALPYFNSQGHYGSRVVIDDNGNLFISTGDRMSDENRMRVQELDNGHGKVVHLTPEGNPVEEGPFDSEIYSLGHRNIQGLSIHPETGELWASEMGPRGGDELNLIQPGKNYGWPLVSYGIEYGGSSIGEGISQMEGMEEPVYYWDPVIAPSGMTFYSSNDMPEWQNNLFIGGLRGQHISRLIIEDNKVVGEERLLKDLGERFRDITVGNDGKLYTITDSGNVYRIGK